MQGALQSFKVLTIRKRQETVKLVSIALDITDEEVPKVAEENEISSFSPAPICWQPNFFSLRAFIKINYRIIFLTLKSLTVYKSFDG